MFIVLTADVWSNMHYQHYRAVGGFLASTYFLSLVIFGQYVLLMLFVAILVKNFDENSFDKSVTENIEKNPKKHRIKKLWKKVKRGLYLCLECKCFKK